MNDIRSSLPKMFTDVMVFGRIKGQNVLHQWWEARRWTNVQSRDPEPLGEWQWVTPCGGEVREVTHWLPLPDAIPVRFFVPRAWEKNPVDEDDPTRK